jgi:polyisoprenoid-binding protein YceI
MTPLKTAAVALAAFAAAGAAQAQAPVADTRPDATPAGAYKLESSHAQVLFSVSHMGTSTWYGTFSGAEGSATLDPKDPARNSVRITIPAASIATISAKLDGELKSADWFDAAKYPQIVFKSAKVAFTGPGRADVTGDLTLHGVTRPVTLHVTFKGAGPNPMTKAYTAGFDATGRLRRSDFGVSKYVPLVGDEVDLILSAPFVKAG